MPFPLYISKKYKECFDQLKVRASIDDEKVSVMISRAIKNYMLYLDNTHEILLDESKWKEELDKMSPKNLKNLDTLISQLHDTIQDRVWKKK